MKKLFFILLLAASLPAAAQIFIDKGKIEYEVRTNNHKIFGDGIWADMAKEKFPKFSTSYYDLIFNENKAVYKFNRYDENSKLPWGNGSTEDNIWYNDYAAGTFVDQKYVFDDLYLLADSLTKIEWKIDPTESREIAGFNCRKAVGKLFDSVYVFAFYTDEITVSGGPMGVNGLPGMIMGITIPRMFTSWIATKVEINGVNLSLITEPKKGKKRKAKDLQQTVLKATKDWGTWGQQSVWNIFL
jgi:GLPGLI family protein